MGSKISSLLPYALDAAAIATGNPELLPLTQAAGTTGSNLLQGQSFGKSLGQGAISGAEAFGGQELLPVAGNAFSSAFPETASSLGITGGANSLTDLVGQTTGGGSLSGPGTIGGDVSRLLSGGSTAGSGLGSLLTGSGNAAAPAASGGVNLGSSQISLPSSTGGSGDFAKGLAGNSPSFSAPSTLASTPSAGIGGGASSYGSGGLGTLLSVGGAANSLMANDQAQKDLLKAQKNSMNVLQPYLNSGGSANAKLSDLLGTSSNTGASGYGTLGQPFTPGDLTQDPGYKFQLEQGDLALQRQQAAKGNLDSGAALKAAQDYGQGLAGTTYNNAYQRYLQGQQQQYGMLAGQSGSGQSAAGTAADVFGNTGNTQAAAGINSANIVNQSLAGLLTGSGAKRPVNIGGQIYYM